MRIPTGGRLLDRVCYCMRKVENATNIVGEPIKVRDTFPYNPESKTAPETAKRWASTGTFDHKINNWVPGPEPEIIERDNSPFSITITDLHVRGEGGRAYKVVDSEMRRFDLREDQVIEVMKNVGILPGGGVNATFVWGILGSQMRLVLVDGELYKSMVKGASDKKASDVAKKDGSAPNESTFQFGRIYRKKDKSLYVFVGKVKFPGKNKPSCAFARLPEKPFAWTDEQLENYGGGGGHEKYYHDKRIDERNVALKWDTMTWMERAQWTWYDSRKHDATFYKVAPDYYDSPVDIELLSAPKSFVEEVNEDCAELAQVLRDNVGSKHNYVNGYGEDIAEQLYVAQRGGARREWYVNDSSTWNRSYEERERLKNAHHSLVKAEYIKCRTEFMKGLTWL